jgi:hypothetical protein
MNTRTGSIPARLTRSLRRIGLWLFAALALIVLLVWLVPLPRNEFWISDGYSVRIGEHHIDVRMWASDPQMVDGELQPGPDTHSPPMWFWLALAGFPAGMLWWVRVREHRQARPPGPVSCTVTPP